LFTTFEQIFEHDVQGVKKKKSYHHIVSTKEIKTLEQYKDIGAGALNYS
jgi:hypothetical protein